MPLSTWPPSLTIQSPFLIGRDVTHRPFRAHCSLCNCNVGGGIHALTRAGSSVLFFRRSAGERPEADSTCPLHPLPTCWRKLKDSSLSSLWLRLNPIVRLSKGFTERDLKHAFEPRRIAPVLHPFLHYGLFDIQCCRAGAYDQGH